MKKMRYKEKKTAGQSNYKFERGITLGGFLKCKTTSMGFVKCHGKLTATLEAHQHMRAHTHTIHNHMD